MKIAVVRSNGNLERRIMRVLQNNNFNGEIIDKVTRLTVINYDYIIFSSEHTTPNLPKLIEQIVLEKKAIVLYISKTLSIGQFYSVMNDIYFGVISDIDLAVELKHSIEFSQRYIHTIKNLKHENKKLKDQIDLLKNTSKAKRILMSKGLSEEESHQFIQRKCMDLRLPRKRIVNLIIQNKIDI